MVCGQPIRQTLWTYYWAEKRRYCVCWQENKRTNTRLLALFPGLSGWASTRKVKPIRILLKQDSEWQWHQLGHMQVCISLQTANHASTPPLKFFTGWKPFLLPNQQHQSTEGNTQANTFSSLIYTLSTWWVSQITITAKCQLYMS